jgi:predicted small secreted protein
MKKGYLISLIFAFAIALTTVTSCNQTPAGADVNDSTSVTATVDTTNWGVDTTAVDTSLLK